MMKGFRTVIMNVVMPLLQLAAGLTYGSVTINMILAGLHGALGLWLRSVTDTPIFQATPTA